MMNRLSFLLLSVLGLVLCASCGDDDPEQGETMFSYTAVLTGTEAFLANDALVEKVKGMLSEKGIESGTTFTYRSEDDANAVYSAALDTLRKHDWRLDQVPVASNTAYTFSLRRADGGFMRIQELTVRPLYYRLEKAEVSSALANNMAAVAKVDELVAAHCTYPNFLGVAGNLQAVKDSIEAIKADLAAYNWKNNDVSILPSSQLSLTVRFGHAAPASDDPYVYNSGLIVLE